jgi:uncharacterized protein (TIGR00251 family)
MGIVLVPELAKSLKTNGELHLKLKVLPKSNRSELAGFMADGTLKVRLHAPPERGKANAELRLLLARELQVSLDKVQIVSGETSQHKQVRIRL